MNFFYIVIESLICGLTMIERQTNPETITDCNKWLEDNWVEELQNLKRYFF